MTSDEINQLQQLSLRVRGHIVRMSTDGGCFTGASLSCTDLLVFLYTQFLNIRPGYTSDPDRDYLFLSKGHDVPALYGLFAELGFIEKSRLENHLSAGDHLYWHPNRRIPGIEFHSGSLGHLPAVGAGVALDCKRESAPNRIVVVLGDGELNEGSVWETALVAAALKLDNMIWVVDRNGYQANVSTESLIPLDSITQKFESFGWNAAEVDGHSFETLARVFDTIAQGSGKPHVVVANTKRGKGLPSIEDRADRWFCNFSKEEVENLLDELHGHATTTLTSQTLTVR